MIENQIFGDGVTTFMPMAPVFKVSWNKFAN
jgi:hypothetical protein